MKTPHFGEFAAKRGRNLATFLLGEERGSATVEFVVWIPFFMALVGGITDISILFNTHARMFDVARDAARLVALHQMEEDAAETFGDQQFSAVSGETEIEVAGGIVTATIRVPLANTVVFSTIFVGEAVLQSSVTMVEETAS